MKFSVILAAGAVALALPLAGCGQGNAKKDAETAGAASAPAAMRSGPRTGLWRLTSTNTIAGTTPLVQEVCVTSETFEPPSPDRTGTESELTCTPPSGFAREGDAMVARVACTGPNGRSMESTVSVTGDMDTRYTMVSTTRLTPVPRSGMGEVTMTIQGERIGDCPA